MIYVYLGIIAPILLNALHAIVGVLILKNNHSVTSLGFTGISFLTKSIGLLFLTWFGIKVLELDFKIYVPILTFFWFITHIFEGLFIQHYIKKKESSLIKSIQL